ncbi:hypothetical protein VST7929_00173 [Vibrio stylophorae]|uniref:Diphthamide synthase domain-containing protein n=1 Tax=Vibrio stylophorae TaxID=659351 RepID=A0ABM8ZPX8_9VIBR|nr:ATPase [Vibrio stylophorae]CAH0532354.1 hypothetical protein VST7929_00173 [Vibrio stylophorae]
MQKINVIISWSSGKDATLVLERLMEDPRYQVVGLFTTYVAKEVPFQATPLAVVSLQAQRLGLPLVLIELPEVFPSNAIYQSTIINGLKDSGLPIDAVAFGDMFCNGIAAYRRSYIEPAGWQCVLPLLGESSAALAQEIIARGIETHIVTVDSQQLSPEFCGHPYNAKLLETLPQSVDPCGEDGEFHTLVTNTRSFSAPIAVQQTHVEKTERFVYQRYQVQ